MEKADLMAIVALAVRNELEVSGAEDLTFDEYSSLLGPDAILDSFGLVNVIIEVEQVLLEDHDLSITLVDERAMSQRNSPFRTPDSLATYAYELITDGDRT